MLQQPTEMLKFFKLWNDIIADHYHTILRAARLRQHLRMFPSIDPVPFARWLLMSLMEAADDIQAREEMGQQFCYHIRDMSAQDKKREIQEGVGAPASALSTRVLEPRRLRWYTGYGLGRAREPLVSRILRGIAEEDLILHYARWRWYRGGHRHLPGPFLELAY